jgi:hypothetical protein
MQATGQNDSPRHVLTSFDSSSRRINEQRSGLLIRGSGFKSLAAHPYWPGTSKCQVVLLSGPVGPSLVGLESVPLRGRLPASRTSRGRRCSFRAELDGDAQRRGLDHCVEDVADAVGTGRGASSAKVLASGAVCGPGPA